MENPYYLHRTCIGKINRNYPVTREVTDQGAHLVISVVPHYLRQSCIIKLLNLHVHKTRKLIKNESFFFYWL